MIENCDRAGVVNFLLSPVMEMQGLRYGAEVH
jgi:hypothetical protein